jgi:uncharacterized membrane protein
MNSRVKLLGHPLHPMLVVYPLGLLSTAVILDLIFMGNENRALSIASYWMITAGLIGGLLAAVVGFLEWMAVPNNSRAKSIGLYHGLGNLVITLLFAGSWWLRTGVEDNVPSPTAFILALLGFALALVTGWLGGELVYRLGVGVDHGANVDAPSSLSDKEASTTGNPRKHSGRTTAR